MLSTKNFSCKDRHRLKVKGQKKIFHENGNQKKIEVTLHISEKIDFKTKNCNKKHRQALHNNEEVNNKSDKTFVNLYASNTGVPQYIKEYKKT